MKLEELSPKAREAFGKTLIDISVAIYKSVILLFTVVPLAALASSIFSEEEADVSSIVRIIDGLAIDTKITIFILIAVAFLTAHYFRKEGLKHIHQSETKDSW